MVSRQLHQEGSAMDENQPPLSQGRIDPRAIVLTLDDGLAAAALPYAPDRYFEGHGTAIPLDALRLSRARPKGIANAIGFMREAYDGLRPRREPVAIARDGDRFVVLDGNSTVAVAAAAGWPDVPCRIALPD
ncbi:MAG: hypothetical protein PGN08_03020 [Sphingomonas taxi]